MHVPANIQPLLIAIPLVAWGLYRRTRRVIGRQKLTRARPWITICVFTLLVALMVFSAAAGPFANARLLLALVGGVAGGIALGVFGLGKTKFENTAEGMFYTPNAHLGIALSLLFSARVIYRFFVMYSIDPQSPPRPGDFASSPLTLGIFGLLAGYYVVYAIGLVRWRMRVQREGR